jgi:hypothetical protein
MFINAASTISYQPTFRNKGFSSVLNDLDFSSQLISPDYGEFIPAMERRRMTHVQKMSIACAIDCLQQAEIEQPDAIIVGTSMGCSVNTKNFLDKIISAGEGPLSPTSFIVSTHNTITGQIALLLKNHGYNMTYTQNSLSFEQSLMDAMMCINNGCTNVLIGGADEEEDAIYNMRARLKNSKIVLTSGASFFILSREKKKTNSVSLVDVGSFGLIDNAAEPTQNFLDANHLSPDEISLVLFAFSDESKLNELKLIFGVEKLVDYQKITGTYYSASAFAMHYAIDILFTKEQPGFGNGVKNILVYNNLIPENLGLILLKTKNE